MKSIEGRCGNKCVVRAGRFPAPEVLRQNLRQVPTRVTFSASQNYTWVGGGGGRGNTGGRGGGETRVGCIRTTFTGGQREGKFHREKRGEDKDQVKVFFF